MKRRKKPMRKKTIRLGAVLLLLMILVGAAVYTVWILPAREGETVVYKEETVQRGDVVLGVMESGNIALGESEISYDVELKDDSDSTDDSESGDSDDSNEDEEDEEEIRYLEIEDVFVVIGQRISEGDPLFSITEESRKSVVRRLKSDVTEIHYRERRQSHHHPGGGKSGRSGKCNGTGKGCAGAALAQRCLHHVRCGKQDGSSFRVQ